MKTPEIHITVCAPAGVGKTALAYAIGQFLGSAMLRADIRDDNGVGVVEEAPEMVHKTLAKRLQAIREKQVPITIRTINTRVVGADSAFTVVGYYADNLQPFVFHLAADTPEAARERLFEVAEGDPVVLSVFIGHLHTLL
jgi:hypothetical protein